MSQSSILSAYMSSQGPQVLTLFGHRTRGIPGIEIAHSGKLIVPLKEKMFYLSRLNNLKIPMYRYRLSIDLPYKARLHEDDLKSLELPLLLLFWHLAEVLPVQSLEDCFCWGRVNCMGEIFEHIPSQSLVQKTKVSLLEKRGRELKIISDCDLKFDFVKRISLRDLLADLGQFYYERPSANYLNGMVK